MILVLGGLGEFPSLYITQLSVCTCALRRVRRQHLVAVHSVLHLGFIHLALAPSTSVGSYRNPHFFICGSLEHSPSSLGWFTLSAGSLIEPPF